MWPGVAIDTAIDIDIDIDKDAIDPDHLISPEERLKVAMALQ